MGEVIVNTAIAAVIIVPIYYLLRSVIVMVNRIKRKFLSRKHLCREVKRVIWFYHL